MDSSSILVVMRLLLALALLAPLALQAQETAPLSEVAARTARIGKAWLHKQPLAGELAYDYARAGKRLILKPGPDGFERECIVTFDADRQPYDLLLVSKRTKKDKGALYLIDSMTLRVDLDGKLIAAVRASGKNDAIMRSTMSVEDFYVRQVHAREVAFFQKDAAKNSAAVPLLE